MKYLIASLILICVLWTASCSKNQATASVPKIKTITTTRNNTTKTDTFYYNSAGNVSRIGSSNNTSSTFVYSAGSITEYSYDSIGIASTRSLKLNATGYVDSVSTISNRSVLFYARKYYYDANNCTSSIIDYDSTGHVVIKFIYTWTNGNIASIVYLNDTGYISKTVVYAYSPGILNTIGNANIGEAFFGASSANATLYTTFIANAQTTDNSYQYKLDNQSRIDSLIEILSSNNLYIVAYTYY